jgi:hypothetical protein
MVDADHRFVIEQPPAGEGVPALEAEVDAALAAAPDAELLAAPGAAADQGPTADQVASWSMYTGAASSLLANLLLPQWELSQAETTEVGESLAMILALHFPGGIEGKYAGYFRLIACTGIIVATRAAANGGKLPPIGPRLKKREETGTAGDSAGAAAAAAPEPAAVQ